MAERPKPFSRARPRSEFLKRYNAMQEAKKKAEEEEINFSAESVIISTPAPATRLAPEAAKPFKPITNINYRGRVIDDILRKEDEEAARQAAVNKKHQDSMDLLRKLSRVGTPSPPQPKAPILQTGDSDEDASPERKPISNIRRALSIPQTRDMIDASAPQRKATSIVPTFSNTQARGSDQDALPERKHNTTNVRQTHSHTQMQSASRRIMSEPVHPKSALEAVVSEAKEGKDPHHYGDETMASLENILHPSIDPTNSTFTNEPTPKQEETQEQYLTQTEKDRRQEKLALEAMSKRLTSTSSSLKDANKGLRRIENRIEGTSNDAGQAPLPHSDQAETAAPNTQPEIHILDIHTGRSTNICSHCGRGDTSLWRGLWLELRNNFYTYDTTKHIHLTWLGWTFILWWIWFIFECALCTELCDYFQGPVIPFVTLHYAVRPLIPILRPLFAFIAWSSSTLLNLLFGDLATSSKSATATATMTRNTIGHDGLWATTTRLMTASATRAIQSAMEAVDEAGFMWDDEMIL